MVLEFKTLTHRLLVSAATCFLTAKCNNQDNSDILAITHLSNAIRFWSHQGDTTIFAEQLKAPLDVRNDVVHRNSISASFGASFLRSSTKSEEILSIWHETKAAPSCLKSARDKKGPIFYRGIEIQSSPCCHIVSYFRLRHFATCHISPGLNTEALSMLLHTQCAGEAIYKSGLIPALAKHRAPLSGCNLFRLPSDTNVHEGRANWIQPPPPKKQEGKCT